MQKQIRTHEIVLCFVHAYYSEMGRLWMVFCTNIGVMGLEYRIKTFENHVPTRIHNNIWKVSPRKLLRKKEINGEGKTFTLPGLLEDISRAGYF